MPYLVSKLSPLSTSQQSSFVYHRVLFPRAPDLNVVVVPYQILLPCVKVYQVYVGKSVGGGQLSVHQTTACSVRERANWMYRCTGATSVRSPLSAERCNAPLVCRCSGKSSNFNRGARNEHSINLKKIDNAGIIEPSFVIFWNMVKTWIA